MSLALSWGLSLASGAQSGPCVVRIRASAATQEVTVRMTDCCSDRFDMCMLQGADKTFILTDAATADFSGATEITFDVWDSIGGVSVLSYSLTGGEISLPDDNKISFAIPNATSTTLTAKRLYAEAWVTFADGTRIGAKGMFRVEDTRKFDA